MTGIFVGVLNASPFDITIEGIIPGGEGKEIRLLEYGDLISYREIQIEATTCNKNGGFSFSFTRFEPQYIFFRIDHARMGMFVEPGENYQLVFDSINFSALDDKINPYLNPWYFDFELADSSLNSTIDDFDDLLYEFLSENFRTIQRGRNQQAFTSFLNLADSLFSDSENTYFRNYFRYKLGYYLHVSNMRTFTDMYKEFFMNKPIQYQNTQYMNLFNTLFETYIFAGSRRISGYDLRYTVNDLGSYHALMDSLGKDTLLRNEAFRELVMIKGLQDMHGDPDYETNRVEHLLKYVEENSKFPQHRIIAKNIVYQKNYLVQGSPAPSFQLINNNKDSVNIPEDFSGKYLYIGFWASWCENCQLDFIALKELYENFEADLEIVTISTDRHINQYEEFLTQNQFPWPDYHFGYNFKLLDDFQVRSLPAYVLIDRKGDIVTFPAQRPSDDLFSWLEWLVARDKRNMQQN
jgi:thiol-disulfide isomerase/thioredoxin